MAVSVSPTIPTESSTAAPAGGFSGWFKNIGDWIKSLSPAGATEYETAWTAVTITGSGWGSTGDFVDANYMDIEAFLVVDSIGSTSGMRDAVVVREDPTDPGFLYATARSPESVVVFDLSLVVDDDQKDIVQQAAVATLPGRSVLDDEGVPNFSIVAGAGIAATDQDELLVAQYRANSLYVYDLTRGTHGELVRTVPFLGENPHVVRVSPDGRYALVANYLGEVSEEGEINSTLAVVDLRAGSSTRLEPIAWIVNK